MTMKPVDEKILDPEHDHPCRKTCSGWEQGRNRGALEERKKQWASPSEAIWRSRFQCLCSYLEDISIEMKNAGLETPTEYPISTSEELFISYCWDVVDTEAKAKELFGGRYERWVRG